MNRASSANARIAEAIPHETRQAALHGCLPAVKPRSRGAWTGPRPVHVALAFMAGAVGARAKILAPIK